MEVQEVKEQLKAIFRTVINNDKWITIHPHGEESDDYRRLKLEDGESPKEAIDRVYKKEDKKQPDIKEEKKQKDPEVLKYQEKWENIYKDDFYDIDTLKEEKAALIQKAGSWNNEQVGKLNAVIKAIKEKDDKLQLEEKGEPKKYTYTLTKKEVGNDAWLGGMADTGNYYTNGSFAIDKRYLDIKGQEPTKKEEIEKSLKNILKGDSTYRYTPVKDFEVGELKREYGKPIKVAKYSYFDEKNGYERNIYLNKKYNDLFKNFDLKFGGETEPVFAYKGKDIVGVVMPINAREQSYSKTINNEIEEELTEDKNQLKLKIDNSKEQDMALLEEIKKLITRVENNKENEMEIENAKVDKRDIIRQIMAIAGKEEASEDVKTIAKLAEKLAYDKSEAGTADNEMDKEDPDDEKEVKKVKEEIKEAVENKCKNSVDNSKTDYFAEMNKIYNAAQEAKKENIYISQAQREQDAVDYFKK